jgi:hypothetical protein
MGVPHHSNSRIGRKIIVPALILTYNKWHSGGTVVYAFVTPPMVEKTRHISIFDLERYTRGLVQNRDIERIDQHLVGCPACAYLLESIKRYVRAFTGSLS